ncbi:MAG: zinc ribbon domain-containing protein [Thermoplasmata archaeon]
MARTDTRKCPLCGALLQADSTMCPNCETDTSLFDLEGGSENLAVIKSSKSLDDLLASVLDDWQPKSPKKSVKDESLDDLNLNLPEEPPDKPKLELDILEEDILGKEEPKAMTFECPGCGAEVDEKATKCPSCGALFAEGETFECPVCGSGVSIDSSSCPHCGVRFVDETSSQEATGMAQAELEGADGLDSIDVSKGLERLPQRRGSRVPRQEASSETGEVVGAVMARYRNIRQENPLLAGGSGNLQTSLQEQVQNLKPLVSLARRLRIPVNDTQRVIAQATKRAKARDLGGAVKLAWGARIALEQSVALQVAQRLDLLRKNLEAHKAKGNPFPVAETLVEEAIKEVTEGGLDSAFEKLRLAKEDVASRSSGHSEARYALQAAEALVKDVSHLGVRVEGFKDILSRGKKALKIGDWETASQLAITAQEKAMEAIRGGLAAEMKRAKQMVMELKMQGGDVKAPIELLKQASASIKEKSYGDALKYLKMFKARIKTR